MTKAQKIRAYINSVHTETQHPITSLGIGAHKILTYDNAKEHGLSLAREYGENCCENDYICRIARKMGWKIKRTSLSIVLYHDNKQMEATKTAVNG